MIKAFSGICLGIVVVAGCSSGQAAAPPAGVDARRLGEALLTVPTGMDVAYGPETGAFGELRATKMGIAAMRQAKFDRPACASAGQLDAAAPDVKGAPAAVVAFSSRGGSLTEALVALPAGRTDFPGDLPEGCTSYKATVNGTPVTYRTTALDLPAVGDESRAFMTTASGGGSSTQIGSVAIRHRNVVMSLLVIGTTVKSSQLEQQSRQAYARLLKVVK